jgi:hypothetical protein
LLSLKGLTIAKRLRGSREKSGFIAPRSAEAGEGGIMGAGRAEQSQVRSIPEARQVNPFTRRALVLPEVPAVRAAVQDVYGRHRW